MQAALHGVLCTESMGSVRLGGREESGPQASGEEDTGLLSLGNHLPGNGCIYLSHTQGCCQQQGSALQQWYKQLMCRETSTMLASAWHAAANTDKATYAAGFRNYSHSMLTSADYEVSWVMTYANTWKVCWHACKQKLAHKQ